MGKFFNALKLLGPPGLFLISAIDSAGIPNPGITDWVLLGLAIASPGSMWMLAAIATLGSLIGSAVFFELVYKGGEKISARYASARAERFRGWFVRYGLVTVFITALLPIPILPMKVFVLCSAAMRVNRWRFYATIAAGRIPRYVGFGYLGAVIGEEGRAKLWIKSHLWHMGVLAILISIGLYFLIRWADSNAARKSAAASAAQSAAASAVRTTIE